MSLRDFLMAFVVIFVWGINSVVVRIGVTEFPPIMLTALRFTLVTVVLLPFVRPPKAMLKQIVALGAVLGVGHFGLWFLALSGLEASTAAVVLQVGVPFSAILASFFYKETFGWPTAFGVTGAFTGVYIMAESPSVTNLLYVFIALASGLGWAFGNILIKKITATPLQINAGMSVFAAFFLWCISLASETGHMEAFANAGLKGWGAVAFTGLVASITAYTIWYHLLAKHDVSRVVFLTFLSPVIGLVSGILILSEPVTWQKITGAILLTGAVLFIQLQRRKIKT